MFSSFTLFKIFYGICDRNDVSNEVMFSERNCTSKNLIYIFFNSHVNYIAIKTNKKIIIIKRTFYRLNNQIYGALRSESVCQFVDS